jgi:hypothetical protein
MVLVSAHRPLFSNPANGHGRRLQRKKWARDSSLRVTQNVRLLDARDVVIIHSRAARCDKSSNERRLFGSFKQRHLELFDVNEDVLKQPLLALEI